MCLYFQCTVDIDGEMVPCKEQHDADKILAILPTTMYFTQFKNLTLDKIVKCVGNNFYRACYSFHSSYTEVKDLISYLNPDKVFANVKAPTDSSLNVVSLCVTKVIYYIPAPVNKVFGGR